MEQISKRLMNWASVLGPAAREQAERTASMPFIYPHLALMPDAHLGKGSTVGSVIPTLDAIIPAAVGVDIGCGMMAVRTQFSGDDVHVLPVHAQLADRAGQSAEQAARVLVRGRLVGDYRGGTPRFFTVDAAPGENNAAVWVGGGAPAVGPNGDLWVATGNGSLDKHPYDNSDAVLELSPSLRLLQFFAGLPARSARRAAP